MNTRTRAGDHGRTPTARPSTPTRHGPLRRVDAAPSRQHVRWTEQDTRRLYERVRTRLPGLDTLALDRLDRYADLLIRWNRTYNLLGATTTDALVDEHLDDALATIPTLDTHLSPWTNPRLHDIGSGAGLPGLPLAITRMDWHLVLVEPLGKKAAFLRQAVGELHLDNVRVQECRLEEAVIEPRPAPHFICRALMRLADFAALCRPHASKDSLLFAMKAARTDAEIAELPTTVRLHASETLVPSDPATDRRLVVLSLPEPRPGDAVWPSR